MSFFSPQKAAPIPDSVWVFPPLGGEQAVLELDVVTALMVLLTAVHVTKHGAWPLAVAGLLLGLVVEHASLRLGGTHCHASSRYLNISDCSSANSVFYYMPWVYSCVTAAQRLVPVRSWVFPPLCGMLFFGMCGVYESQGPIMGWWLWPRADGLVKPGCDIWQHGPPGEDGRGLAVSDHAAAALAGRAFGVPALAPFFHYAFGWGIGLALQLLGGECATFGRALPVVLLGAALGLLWDPPIRLLGWLLGASQLAAAAFLMQLALVLPLVLGPPLSAAAPRDALLFGVPLANQAFFLSHAFVGRGAAALPAPLKLFVGAVGLCALAANARAAGLVGGGGAGAEGGRAATAKAAWLDRLQKDAHASELDPSNTRPAVFVLLALVQPPACAAIAAALSLPAWLALLPIGSHAVGFVVSHYLLKHDRFFDIWGESTFFPLIVASHWSLPAAAAAPRQRLVTGLALLWCARLGLFLGWRIFARGSDWRFTKLMSEPAYNAFGWVSQGTWIFLQGTCVWLAHAAPPAAAAAPLGWLDAAGVAVWAAGLLIEHVADAQKTAWNRATPSGGQKTWLASGLWRYSRHPNYHGEVQLWLGIALVAAAGAPSFAAALLGLVSPAWSAFFLVFTSLMLLEKRLDARFGGNPEYEAYKQRTSVLLLLPPAAEAGAKRE